MIINAAEPDAFETDEAVMLSSLEDDLAFGIAAIRERVAREKAAQARLRERELLLNLINNIPDPIFYKNT